jgi:transcriptional repressor NrdR
MLRFSLEQGNATLMQCPFCRKDNDRVVDSRAGENGRVTRRRRECLECKRRYTSYERVEETPLRVIKKDGSRVGFDRAKVRAGIEKACEKRPVSADEIARIVEAIEAEAIEGFEREVPTHFIGERVMEELRRLDEVAYVRFASVYRAFKDVNEFRHVLDEFMKGGGGAADRVGA